MSGQTSKSQGAPTEHSPSDLDPKHAESYHSQEASSFTDLSSASPTNTSSVSRRLKSIIPTRLRDFSLVKPKKPSVGEEEQDTWGPMGLTLLHSPPNPVIDFIFIHGLRGGSVKTWCKNGDMRLYWPQTWLPRDPDLQNVRIHTFGYNSNWRDNRGDTLDLHDFGRMLFGAMLTSPQLRKGKRTPILLIGHSMGGLVMKKAYLLARQDIRARELVERIKCMVFLATPHRGSGLAKSLNNLLRATGFLSSKQYITDLNPSSGALTGINDEFRFVADALHLWSFYETIKTRTSPTGSAMIVEKDSAVIGHKRETAQRLNADHRGVCKFDSPSDPNYVLVRDSLVKATEDVLGDDEVRLQLRMLESFLDIAHDPDDDLVEIETKKTPGSCDWVTRLSQFERWRDTANVSFLCYWLSGEAASGKSVLSTHIIRHLQDLGADTSYFFFRHGRREQQTVAGLLRGLAFHMAILHPSVREILVAMMETGVGFSKDDETVIWRKVFLSRIFTVPIETAQYWVIDGLDECPHPERLFHLLNKAEPSFPIRVLFSSRRLPNLERSLSSCFNDQLYQHHISTEDTREDIQTFIQNNSHDLPVDHENRQALIDKLVLKSDGCFLWIDLALESLKNVFSEEEIEEVFHQVPAGMEPLYKRILETMKKDAQNIRLTKAILEWAVCGTRPMTINELQDALALSLPATIRNMERMVGELCGQLLRVRDNIVQVIHATARDYLLSEATGSIFAVRKDEVNRKMATICLKFLLGDDMRPPQHPALLSQIVSQSDFVDYACTSFSDHLASSSPESDELFLLVDKFFRTNVLSWVEYTLRHRGNLHYLSRTSKNLHKYLQKRAKHASSKEEKYLNLKKWQIDLLRIASKFGTQLLQNPSAIHFIVPTLCPKESALHSQFADVHGGLELRELGNMSWDDCICYIDYQGTIAMSLAASDMIAIGMRSGVIKVYDQTTCQEIASTNHGEAVRMLRFDSASRRLVSSGYRNMKLWTMQGDLVWSVAHSEGCHLAAMAFSDRDKNLVTVNVKGQLAAWNGENGARRVDEGPGMRDAHQNPHLKKASFEEILSADISPKAELLAIAYNGRPPQIWSIERDVMISSCQLARDRSHDHITSPSQVLFNPNPAMQLLAVAYEDGDIAIFNKWAVGKQNELKAVAADSLTLSSTNDGRTLASGDAVGCIKLWDFETLRLLHCISSTETEVRSIAFSGDGTRLYDIRDTETRVWEPSVLVRKTATEESSIGETTMMQAPIRNRKNETVGITAILAPPDAGCVFVGRHDGSMLMYSETTGRVVAPLYLHSSNGFVKSMSWNTAMVASADSFGNIEVHSFQGRRSGPWTLRSKVYGSKLSGPFTDIRLHPADSWLLISQPSCSVLVDVTSKAEYAFSIDKQDDYQAWSWLNMPNTGALLLGARRCAIDIFMPDRRGRDLWPMHTCCLLTDGEDHKQAIERLTTDNSGKYIALWLKASPQHPEKPRLLVYESTILSGLGKETPVGKVTEPQPIATAIGSHIKALLGFDGDRIIFLDQQLWVRSIDLSKLSEAAPTHSSQQGRMPSAKHFFIPRELIGGSSNVDGVLTGNGAVVFPREGELAVFRNALEWTFTEAGSESSGGAGASRAEDRSKRGR